MQASHEITDNAAAVQCRFDYLPPIIAARIKFPVLLVISLTAVIAYLDIYMHLCARLNSAVTEQVTKN